MVRGRPCASSGSSTATGKPMRYSCRNALSATDVWARFDGDPPTGAKDAVNEYVAAVNENRIRTNIEIGRNPFLVGNYDPDAGPLEDDAVDMTLTLLPACRTHDELLRLLDVPEMNEDKEYNQPRPF